MLQTRRKTLRPNKSCWCCRKLRQRKAQVALTWFVSRVIQFHLVMWGGTSSRNTFRIMCHSRKWNHLSVEKITVFITGLVYFGRAFPSVSSDPFPGLRLRCPISFATVLHLLFLRHFNPSFRTKMNINLQNGARIENKMKARWTAEKSFSGIPIFPHLLIFFLPRIHQVSCLEW